MYPFNFDVLDKVIDEDRKAYHEYLQGLSAAQMVYMLFGEMDDENTEKEVKYQGAKSAWD